MDSGKYIKRNCLLLLSFSFLFYIFIYVLVSLEDKNGFVTLNGGTWILLEDNCKTCVSSFYI